MTTDAVTILKSAHGHPVNKSIRRLGDTIIKAMARNGGCYVAQTVPAPDPALMGDILRELGANANATLSLGLFRDSPDEPFMVLPAKVLAKLIGVDPDDKDALTGFQTVDGWQCAARLKANMVFGSWMLIDRDCVVGMPPALAALDRNQWLAAMDLLLPGLASAGRILLPRTSCRITVDGKPMDSKSHHLFVQVTDPSDIARVWGQMLPKAFLTPLNPPWEDAEPVTLGFLRPKFSRTEPKVVVAEQPWSIYDPSTCSPERLVFDGKPVVTGAGLEVLEPQLEIHEGGRLDLAAFQDLEAADLPTVNERTGMNVRLEFIGEGKRARVTGVRFNSATLSLDTELETETGCTTVGELLRQGAGHIRCQAPFRESISWAAYYGLHHDGTPFVWDTGTNT